jgi:beta-galactosidase
MHMRLRLSLAFSLFLTWSLASASADSVERERLSLDQGWSFTRNDPLDASKDSLSYLKTPAVKAAVLASTEPSGLKEQQYALGADISYAQPGFDAKSWRKLNLPHDWGIEGPFDIKLKGETGKLPWFGVAWYRRTLNIPEADRGKQFYLDIDGAMSYSMVWCNGRFVGGWPYGYTSYRLDLTPYLRPGADNVLAIRLDNPPDSSRWYPGGGIYRNVWLVKTAPVNIDQWGTTVTTPEVSADAAKAAIQVAVVNRSARVAAVAVRTEFFFDGKSVGATETASQKIAPDSRQMFAGSATLRSPALWSPETPALYRAVTSVVADGQLVDRYETTFGVRTIAFTADDGFHLNGRRVQIKGVCLHHDLGALGAAFNLRAAERQLQMMKEMGANALRLTHNPAAPELLGLCDRMGILVIAEAFDCWKRGKKPNDYSILFDDWHDKDLRALVRRDRNHPSVILWSIGNELVELRTPEQAIPIATELSAIVREEDPTRLSTLGSNANPASFNGVQKTVGVFGQNYQFGDYGRFRRENPTIPLIGSETSSVVSSRGEYFFQTPAQADAAHAAAVDAAQRRNRKPPEKPAFSPVSPDSGQGKANFQVSSYDLYGPGWFHTPDGEFSALDRNPFVAGEFVWTGFDYLGEPTPYNNDTTNLLNFNSDASGRAEMERELKELGKVRVPSRSSYFGILDLAGFKKDRFYLYQARWRPDLPMAHLLPHWNWPDRAGLVTPVHLYTSGDEAELFLNGVSQGRKKKESGQYRLRWDDVVYAPGTLKAVAYKNGKPWAEDVATTTGSAAKLALAADRAEIAADGADLSFITVTVADAQGRLVPQTRNLVQFDLSGPGELVAVDNGDATSLEPFQASKRAAYNGIALAIVRLKPGAKEPVTLRAKAEGLAPAAVTLPPAR